MAAATGVALALLMVAAGCGGDNSEPTAGTTVPPTSPPATAASTTATTKPASPTSTATTVTTKPATTTTRAPATTGPPTTVAGDRCHTSELSASLGRPDAGAGNIYIPLILKNVSTRTCEVAGFPGVSLLDASGAQIGQPATRETGLPEAAVKLAPGAVASTALHTQSEGVSPGGCLPPSVKVRVFPPNELDSLDIAGEVTVCGNSFSLSPLVAGATGR